MVPAAIVVLEALPLTVQQQLDMRSLPAPGIRTPISTGRRLMRSGEILAGIYAQVLGVERVGVDDSFFDLGGDSISSMRVVARARAAGLIVPRGMCSLSRAWRGWRRWPVLPVGTPVWSTRAWARWWRPDHALAA